MLEQSATPIMVPGRHLHRLIFQCCTTDSQIEACLKNTSQNLQSLSAPDGQVSWSEFSQLCENIVLLFDDDHLIRTSSSLVTGFSRLLLMGRYAYDLRELYYYGFGPNGLLTGQYPIDVIVDSAGAKRLVFHCRMRGDLNPLKVLDLLIFGLLLELPVPFGYPKPSVKMARTSKGAIFDVRFETNRKLLSRISAAAGWLFSVKDVAAELGRTYRELTDQYQRSAADSRRAEAMRISRNNSEAKYQILADTVQDIIWTTDLELNFTYVSPAVTRILGYAPSDCQGLALTDLLPGHTASYLKNFVTEQLLHYGGSPDPGAERTIQVKVLHRDGPEIPFEVRASFLIEPSAAAIGVIGVARDITDRLANEAQRKHLERQIQASQRTESIGLLAGSMATDFDEILERIILEATQLAEENGIRDSSRHHLDALREAAGRASVMNSKLLTFGGRRAMQTERIDINDLLVQIKDMLAGLLSDSVHLNLLLAQRPVELTADSAQLEQALVNIVLNAQDAMPQGGNISIETNSVELDGSDATPARTGQFAQITISDTGAGISPDVLVHIYEPFYTTKKPGHGTGLGLSVVLGIIEQHSGWIDVSTRVGAGTRFTIYLPAGRSVIASPQPPPTLGLTLSRQVQQSKDR